VTGPWKLKELVEVCRAAMALVGASPGESRRVRWRPNARLVRYYTTLGILDRPLEMRGRTAYYGPRHLLQLLAVKQLQSAGKSLAEVQQKLAGLPTARLRQLAELPEDWEDRLVPAASTQEDGSEDEDAEEDEDGRGEGGPEKPATEVGRAQRFWERGPALPEESPPEPPPPRAQPPAAPRPLAGLALAEGAQLILTPDLATRVDDAALAAAARPLLEYLESLTTKECPDV